MGIEWMGGAVWRWAESARRGTTDDMGRRTIVRVVSLLAMDDREKREGEIYCPRRRTGTESAEPPKIFVMSIVVSCGGRDLRWRREPTERSSELPRSGARDRFIKSRPSIASAV